MAMATETKTEKAEPVPLEGQALANILPPKDVMEAVANELGESIPADVSPDDLIASAMNSMSGVGIPKGALPELKAPKVGKDQAVAGETEETPSDETEPVAETQTPAEIKFDSLPNEFIYKDGRKITREQLDNFLAKTPDIEKGFAAVTQRYQEVAKKEEQLQNEGWWALRDRAANDPQFYQSLVAFLQNGGTMQQAAAQTRAAASVLDLPPEAKGDPALEAYGRKVNEAIARLQGEIAQVQGQFSGTVGQYQQQLQGALQQLEAVQRVVGATAITRQKQEMTDHLKRLGVPSDEQMLNRAMEVAYQKNIPVYDPSSDVDAFRIVAFPALAHRASGGNGSNGKATASPQKTLPNRGVASEGSDALTPEERGMFDWWNRENVALTGKRGTVSQWRKLMET